MVKILETEEQDIRKIIEMLQDLPEDRDKRKLYIGIMLGTLFAHNIKNMETIKEVIDEGEPLLELIEVAAYERLEKLKEKQRNKEFYG